jgi:hypothetical protein
MYHSMPRSMNPGRSSLDAASSPIECHLFDAHGPILSFLSRLIRLHFQSPAEMHEFARNKHQSFSHSRPGISLTESRYAEINQGLGPLQLKQEGVSERRLGGYLTGD